MKFHYVYILQSEKVPERFYVGRSDDLSRRLDEHNQGKVPHTSKFSPWKIKTALAFRDASKAISFECYLKSPSGRAFAKKRL